jgi:hypothetical protein
MRSAVLVSALLAIVHGCNDGTPPPASPTTIAVVLEGGTTTATAGVAASDPPATPAPLTTSAGTASAAPPGSAGDAGPDFYACGVDSDCVAVPKANCCPTGALEAVNKQSVDAYRSSLVCEKKHRMCPQFRMLDRRVALCDTDARKCEMVQPAQITCNAAGPNPHACPGGMHCDASGHCTASP